MCLSGSFVFVYRVDGEGVDLGEVFGKLQIRIEPTPMSATPISKVTRMGVRKIECEDSPVYQR